MKHRVDKGMQTFMMGGLMSALKNKYCPIVVSLVRGLSTSSERRQSTVCVALGS